jgi:chromosomal replication initiation ATPase DnaA
MTSVSIRNILQMVALDSHISIKKMISPATDQPIVDARNATMWLARQIKYTLSEIGHAFGGRDDATVQNAIDSIDRLIETDPRLVRWLHTFDAVVTEREPPDAP